MLQNTLAGQRLTDHQLLERLPTTVVAANTVFVSGFPPQATLKAIQKIFGKQGAVRQLHLMPECALGGRCFIEFSEPDGVSNVVLKMSGKVISNCWRLVTKPLRQLREEAGMPAEDAGLGGAHQAGEGELYNPADPQLRPARSDVVESRPAPAQVRGQPVAALPRNAAEPGIISPFAPAVPVEPQGVVYLQLPSPDGQLYYYLPSTNETTWQLPEGANATVWAQLTAPAGSPSSTYYYNTMTRESRWEHRGPFVALDHIPGSASAPATTTPMPSRQPQQAASYGQQRQGLPISISGPPVSASQAGTSSSTLARLQNALAVAGGNTQRAAPTGVVYTPAGAPVPQGGFKLTVFNPFHEEKPCLLLVPFFGQRHLHLQNRDVFVATMSAEQPQDGFLLSTPTPTALQRMITKDMLAKLASVADFTGCLKARARLGFVLVTNSGGLALQQNVHQAELVSAALHGTLRHSFNDCVEAKLFDRMLKLCGLGTALEETVVHQFSVSTPHSQEQVRVTARFDGGRFVVVKAKLHRAKFVWDVLVPNTGGGADVRFLVQTMAVLPDTQGLQRFFDGVTLSDDRVSAPPASGYQIETVRVKNKFHVLRDHLKVSFSRTRQSEYQHGKPHTWQRHEIALSLPGWAASISQAPDSELRHAFLAKVFELLSQVDIPNESLPSRDGDSASKRQRTS